LLSVLQSINAVARGDDRRIAPGASHLMGPDHILLTTDNGDFDCLGTVDDKQPDAAAARLPRPRSPGASADRARCRGAPNAADQRRSSEPWQRYEPRGSAVQGTEWPSA
jgi:hypothetical protein